MFSFLRKLFKYKSKNAQPRLVLPPAAPTRPLEKTVPIPPVAPLSGRTGPVPPAVEQWVKQATQPVDTRARPEVLCGIAPGMTKEEIAAQLALLYRRHNRAASSLEAHLREEAEMMLDVIAAMKQKYLGQNDV